MSIHSKVTEQDLINLCKLVEQQKNQRAHEIENRILKQTHDIKFIKQKAESLSPKTNKLDDVKETTQKIGDVVKRTQQETTQLPIENTPTHQRMENIEGVIYDVELENTLSNMKKFIGLFNIEGRDNGDIFLNGFPVEKMGGSKLKINEKIYDISPESIN